MAIKPLWKKPDLYIAFSILLILFVFIKGFQLLDGTVFFNPSLVLIIGIVVFLLAHPIAILNVKFAAYFPDWAKGKKAIRFITLYGRVVAVLFILGGLYGIIKNIQAMH